MCAGRPVVTTDREDGPGLKKLPGLASLRPRIASLLRTVPVPESCLSPNRHSRIVIVDDRGAIQERVAEVVDAAAVAQRGIGADGAVENSQRAADIENATTRFGRVARNMLSTVRVGPFGHDATTFGKAAVAANRASSHADSAAVPDAATAIRHAVLDHAAREYQFASVEYTATVDTADIAHRDVPHGCAAAAVNREYFVLPGAVNDRAGCAGALNTMRWPAAWLTAARNWFRCSYPCRFAKALTDKCLRAH